MFEVVDENEEEKEEEEEEEEVYGRRWRKVHH